MKSKKSQIKQFLSESNKIEGVYDQDSLQQAQYAWDYLIKQNTLTIDVILKTHKILMLNQPLQPNEKGYFRKRPVYIGGREGVYWEDIPKAIKQWIVNVNDIVVNGQNESEIFLERIIKEQHVTYETIHGFIDGNGRTGRIFLNWTRVKVGLPLLIIHEGVEQMAYYAWFKKN